MPMTKHIPPMTIPITPLHLPAWLELKDVSAIWVSTKQVRVEQNVTIFIARVAGEKLFLYFMKSCMLKPNSKKVNVAMAMPVTRLYLIFSSTKINLAE